MVAQLWNDVFWQTILEQIVFIKNGIITED